MNRRITSPVEIVVFLSSIVFVVGFAGRWFYLFDLASHFRVHAIIAMLLGGIMLAMTNKHFWSRYGCVIGLIGAFTLLPYLRQPLTSTNDQIEPMRIMSVNVLTSNTQYDAAIAYIKKSNPDFVACLETNDVWIKRLNAGLEAWPYRLSRPRSDNFGIAFYSKRPWTSCDAAEYSGISDVYSIDAKFEELGVRVIATHPLPPMQPWLWQDRQRVFDAIANEVKGDSLKTVVVGDLNCTPWSPCFQKFLRDSGLRDSNRGYGFVPTWSPFPALIIGLPIDHVLTSPNVRVLERTVGPNVGSDHRPVVVEFD